MRLLPSFGLIGAGAFAAGIYFSKAGVDSQIDNWLIFAVSLAVAFSGLADLVAVAFRGHRPQWVKSSH